MSIVITYALSAFPNQKVRARKLSAQIVGTPAIIKVLENIASDRSSCFIAFDAALSGAEQTALDGVVAAHEGADDTLFSLLGTSALVGDEKLLIAAWTPLGRALSNPSFFGVDMAQILGRVLCETSALGAGAQLRIIERVAGVEVDLTPTPFEVPASVGAYQFSRFNTQVTLRGGDSVFRLEGRLGGAVSATIRAASIAAIWAQTPP